MANFPPPRGARLAVALAERRAQMKADPAQLTMGAAASEIVQGYFDSNGWDTSIKDNGDGTSTFSASRPAGDSGKREEIMIKYRPEQE